MIIKKIFNVFVIFLSLPYLIDSYCESNETGSPDFKFNHMDCVDCHHRNYNSINDSNLLISSHNEAGIDTCTDCHDKVTLEENHINLSPDKSFFIKARKYPRDFCARCHGTAEELAERTVESTVLKDNKGFVVNPHDIPRVDKHYKIDECYTCHRMHKKNPDVNRYCFGCHHTGEFSCGTCHP